MAGRRLSPEERALWRRVTESVRPLEARDEPSVVDIPALTLSLSKGAPLAEKRLRQAQPERKVQPPGETLDGGWDRRLRRGLVSPDRTIDLHGHTLASAHAMLDQTLDRSIADQVRVILLITGRPPRTGADGRPRGLIRASIGDWLAASRHAGRIAAVRNAHPRHGGAGALYLIMRRGRAPGG